MRLNVCKRLSPCLHIFFSPHWQNGFLVSFKTRKPRRKYKEFNFWTNSDFKLWLFKIEDGRLFPRKVFWWLLPWLKSPKKRLLMFFFLKVLGFASTKFHHGLWSLFATGPHSTNKPWSFPFRFFRSAQDLDKREKVKSYQNLDPPPHP